LASLCFATANIAHATELAEAAQRGDAGRVEALLAGGPNPEQVNASTPDGMSALLFAAQNDDLAMAQQLLESGADAQLANRYGVTPLWLAATNRSAPMVELLLAHGADAKATMPHGETALMAAARSGGVESLRLLLAAGADPNASEAGMGETALMWAAAENHADAIRVLIAGGANPDMHSNELHLAPMNWAQVGMVSTILPVGGWTALMFATRQDSHDAALALAEMGANLDEQDPDGTTALGIAIINAHYDLATALLEAGADPNVVDRTGAGALYSAVEMVSLGREIGIPERPQFQELDAVDMLHRVLAHGADPNARQASPAIARHHGFGDRSLGEGATALMRAARSGDLKSIRILLEAGADPHLAMANGLTALDIADGVGRTRPGLGFRPEPAQPEAAALLREIMGATPKD
jgi:ankyrin repeat protein